MALDMRSFGILRFGTFEVDLRAGELRKQGKRIRLQEQPFQVLTVLLQHPGQVVTREELRNQNWPPDTFVDFDNSLNTAINKLREALSVQLEQSPFLRLVSEEGIQQTLQMMGQPTNVRLTPQIAREVCQFARGPTAPQYWTVPLL